MPASFQALGQEHGPLEFPPSDPDTIWAALYQQALHIARLVCSQRRLRVEPDEVAADFLVSQFDASSPAQPRVVKRFDPTRGNWRAYLHAAVRNQCVRRPRARTNQSLLLDKVRDPKDPAETDRRESLRSAIDRARDDLESHWRDTDRAQHVALFRMATLEQKPRITVANSFDVTRKQTSNRIQTVNRALNRHPLMKQWLRANAS
jgi:DNA-directed RNA polymerase specialized sigma24 family protein